MRTRDLIVAGASAGGVEVLRAFASGLPADLPAAVLVVLHLPAGGTSALPAIPARSGPLPAVPARQGDPPEPGRIYVAPPDHHLLVLGDRLALSHGPTENGHRPAVNALFRPAAVAHGPAVTGVLLSGALDDGVAGLVAIAARGGIVLVQDPDEALFSSMPAGARRHVQVDYVLPAGDMGTAPAKITQEVVDPSAAPPPSDLLTMENDVTRNAGVSNPVETTTASLPGTAAGFSCPDCNGALVELELGRFRCRVGHAWSADALLEAQGSAWERAALRTLDEKARLSRRMADDARKRGSAGVAERYLVTADEAESAAEVLRRHLTGAGPGAEAVS